jgi:hypothetical protein
VVEMGVTNPASPDELRRLAFVRYLYGLGVEQSRQPMPTRLASILTFQDAVELFLGLACERAGQATTDKTRLYEYFELLERSSSPLALVEKAPCGG